MRNFTKGGPWKNAEDEVLKAGVMKYGTNQWSRVASLLISKSAKQCKARWEEWLDPNIKKTEWTREEEEKLLHLAKIAPNMWRMIASQVGRTAAQCLEHYERLLDQVQGRDMDAMDDPRRLKPGEVDPNPEARPARPDPVDMSEDTKEMLSEARARLENTKGKKAKRKAREQELEKARRLASLQKKRELKAAGIILRPSLQKMKKMNKNHEIDYNNEIPLFRKPPPGFFDVTNEQKQTNSIAIDYNREAVQQVYNKKKQEEVDEEELMKQKDQEKIKRRKKDSMPDFLAQTNKKLYQPSAIAKRSKLVLPKPQISDAELEEIGKIGIELKHLAAANGSATDKLLTEYKAQTPGLTPASLSMRTPRTPAAVDTVKLSVQNLIALQNQQTPLKGGKNIELNEQFRDFSGMTPAKHVAATPNPFVTSTPGVSKFNMTPMVTPMRDELHINAGSGFPTPGSTPLKVQNQKLQFYKQQLREKLQSLPAPVTNATTRSSFHVTNDEEDDVSMMGGTDEDDMGELRRRNELLKESRKQERLNRRTQAVQRNLPRPSKFIDAQYDPSTTDGMSEAAQSAQISKLIRQEMVKLIQHDMVMHPIEGIKKGKKMKNKKTVALGYPENRLMQQARQMIAIEQTKFDTPSFETFSSMWDSCVPQVFPTDFNLLERVYNEERAKTQKMEQKLNILTGGYMNKLASIEKNISETANEIEEKQRELQSFSALQDLERNAMRTRELRLTDDIQMVRSKEREIQDRYRELLVEKQQLQDELKIPGL